MQILNIAGYKFIKLNNIPSLHDYLFKLCNHLNLKGTILLSPEGININLSGLFQPIHTFQIQIKDKSDFFDLKFHETYSDFQPFRFLKIKIKNEIITFKQPKANPLAHRAPHISATELKQWLDKEHNITMLDTRNEYEIHFGTFRDSVNLHINDFSEFGAAVVNLEKHKPIVMFCTGGIRCEKAALYLLNHGFSTVYQLDGGILGYFNQIGGKHYEGECFVFDERISLDNQLKPSGKGQCSLCQRPVNQQTLHAICSNCA